MRVTNNTYPETLKAQFQYLQEQQLKYQKQIATGLKLDQASDDPLAFHKARTISEQQASNQAFLDSTHQAMSISEANYKAMTDLQRLITRASEISIRATAPHSPDEYQILGDEMTSILDQVVDLANRKYDGAYLFGGTKNVAPIVETSSGPPPVYEYNNAPLSAAPNTPDGAQTGDYSSNVVTIEIADDREFEVGIVAGRTATDDPAGGSVERPAFNGFLSNGTIDILSTLTSIRDDLVAGTAISNSDLQDVNSAVNLAAEFVGKTASRLSALDLNEATLTDQLRTNVEQLQEASGASLPEAITDLQQIQLNYQAALQSGAKILNLSLLDYLR